MKEYHIYVFTQDSCPPCQRLKEHVSTLTEQEQSELDFVPLKTATGVRTALAEELGVELTPTLVVCHDDHNLRIQPDCFEDWDLVEVPCEKVVGANNIIKTLDATLDAYTYAHPPEWTKTS